jgi:hypothetical protein
MKLVRSDEHFTRTVILLYYYGCLGSIATGIESDSASLYDSLNHSVLEDLLQIC